MRSADGGGDDDDDDGDDSGTGPKMAVGWAIRTTPTSDSSVDSFSTPENGSLSAGMREHAMATKVGVRDVMTVASGSGSVLRAARRTQRPVGISHSGCGKARLTIGAHNCDAAAQRPRP